MMQAVARGSIYIPASFARLSFKNIMSFAVYEVLFLPSSGFLFFVLFSIFFRHLTYKHFYIAARGSYLIW